MIWAYLNIFSPQPLELRILDISHARRAQFIWDSCDKQYLVGGFNPSEKY